MTSCATYYAEHQLVTFKKFNLFLSFSVPYIIIFPYNRVVKYGYKMVSIIYSTFFNSTERYLDPRMKVKINFSVKIILAVVPVPFSLYEYVQKATQYSMKKAGYFQYKL